MRLIIIVTFISALILILYKAWIEKRLKKEWVKIISESIIVFVFIPLCFYFITSYVQNIQNKPILEKNENFQRTLLNSVYSNSVNKEQLDELIKLKHKEIFQSSTEDAEVFARKLLDDLETKKNDLEELSNNSSEMVNKLYLKWKPFWDFVVAAIDDRVNELIKSDNRLKLDTGGHNPIISDVDLRKYGPTSLRSISNEGKTLFSSYYEPGQVREGLCIKDLYMIFRERGGYVAFQFHFSEDKVALSPVYKRYSKLNAHTNLNDPLEDEEFRRTTIEAINLLISSSYIQ